MQKKLPFLVFAAILGLSACNSNSDLERALIGAGAGCIAGEIIDDGECLTGAAVGGAAGALYDDI
ncbi:MAG: YMGG-like glycine zipper-containing protein [Silicimonas sp.]|jgi:hypothetical protein|nr:YMGG-like glycine zipper-containing protein [Silicimonas sp.]